MRRARRPLEVAAFALALAACTVGPQYQPPQTTVPAGFGELGVAGAGTTAASPVVAWWTTFRDPVLDELVERAVRGNLDLRRATARIREARAQLGAAGAEAFPEVDAVGGVTRTRRSGNLADDIPGSRTSTLYRTGFDAVWELDLFGGVRRGVEAARADVEAGVEDRRDVLVTLLAEVARNYVELRGSQREATIARANLAAQRDTLQLTRQRLDAGMSSSLDVARSEAQVETTAAVLPSFDVAARQAIHRLSVLTGAEPNALVPLLAEERAIPGVPQEVPAGLPSDLLRRRPDVRRAERQLAASTARIGVATADLFPRFSLTGVFALESAHARDAFEASSRTGSLGPAVRWPILDFGRIRSSIDVRSAQEEEALAAYEQTVLTSLREVEDALVALGHEQSRRTSLAAAAGANRRAVDLALQLNREGRTDFLSVLQSQRDLFASEDALVRSESAVASDLVALYKALGGGWEVETSAADAPPPGEPGGRVVDVTSPR